MRRAALWISIGIVAGISCGVLATRSIIFRDKLGRISGRGHLLARVQGRGLYQADVDRAISESSYLSGDDDKKAASGKLESPLTKLIADAALMAQATREKIPRTKASREFDLLRSQFRDDRTWTQALHQNGFLAPTLRRQLENDLRGRQWVSKQVAHEIDATEEECRRYYDSHPQNFFSPEHRRVSHLFLAAPPETAPEIVKVKQTLIQSLFVRLAAGEDFAALVAENSEDDATKLRGGDLGYFSALRMPPDFVEAAFKLHPGEISKPLRTRLGFHILELIDVQPARQRTFDEARSEIVTDLENGKRATVIQKLVSELAGQAGYLRPLLGAD